MTNKMKRIFIIATLLSMAMTSSLVGQVNLIKNGEFEELQEGSTWPKEWNCVPYNGVSSSISVEKNGVDGSNVLKMGVASKQAECNISQEITVEANKRYVFEGYFAYSNTPTVSSIIQVEDADGKTLSQLPIRQTALGAQKLPLNEKSFHTFEFKAEQAGLITLRIQMPGGGRLLRLDKLSLTENTEPENDGKTQAAYFVDPIDGNNENSGLTAEEPLKDLEGVFLENAQPGCQVLFKAGTTYQGTLHFKGVKGTAKEPIRISTYWDNGDSAPAATIDGAGEKAAIRLDDCSHFVIENLYITANGGGWKGQEGQDNMRCGVLVNTTLPNDTSEHITLSNLEIKDIFYYDEGYERPKDTGSANGTGGYGYGVRFINQAENTLMRHVSVRDCSIDGVSHTGLKFTGKGGSMSWIRDVEVENVGVIYSGGPGMQMGSVRNAHVHHCSVDQSGSDNDKRNWTRGSGLWTWGCDSVLVEHNRFTNASGPADSFGSHIDFDCKNVIFQYNFYANNIGGFVEILGNSHNCSYRYNISVNDGKRTQGQPGRTIWFSGYCGGSKRKGPYNTYVYNNTIYTSEDMVSRYAIEKTSQGVLLANNIFHIMGETKSVSNSSQPAKPDGPDVFFRNNLFLKENNFPEVQMGGDKAPLFGDANFKNPGGDQIEDYVPQNKDLVYGKGVQIEKLQGDTIGLYLGLSVTKDILGNDLNGRIDLGAVACSEQGSEINEPYFQQTKVFVSGNEVWVIANDVTPITVFDVNGLCIKQGYAKETSFLLMPGMYMLKVGDERHKVLVN